MEEKRKIRIGYVVGDKMDKTVVVAIETLKRHPIYKKTFKKVVRYKAHDENNKCRVGDKVKIIETRPLSRQKRWRVADIITREEVVEVKPQEVVEKREVTLKGGNPAYEYIIKWPINDQVVRYIKFVFLLYDNRGFTIHAGFTDKSYRLINPQLTEMIEHFFPGTYTSPS